MKTLPDKDIREHLFEFLEEKMGKIRIIEERRTGRAVADALMITPGLIYGIEIKSDADTYTRLAKQVENYDSFYDRNILVVGSTHATHAAEHVPDWWGIISAEYDEDGNVDFYVIREPSENPKVDPYNKISILWRIELNHILELNELPRYPQKSKQFVREALVERVSPDILWNQVCDELFERDYNAIEDIITAYRKSKGRRKKRSTGHKKYHRR